jgi:hypothetical protein
MLREKEVLTKNTWLTLIIGTVKVVRETCPTRNGGYLHRQADSHPDGGDTRIHHIRTRGSTIDLLWARRREQRKERRRIIARVCDACLVDMSTHFHALELRVPEDHQCRDLGPLS